MNDFFQNFFNHFEHPSTVEWLGSITGFLCIYLAAKNHILNWPVAIISVTAYIFIFFEAKLYGDMALQIYFLLISVYGWYYWLQNKKSKNKPIVSMAAKNWIWVALSIFALTFILAWFLKHYTKTDVPYVDGFCTAVSVVAQILLTRKILQNWLLWILVDVIYVPLLFYKHLNLSALLYFILILLAIKGYLDWKKIYQNEKTIDV